MKLLVIGNGFDIAHKLPTQYNNFLDFVNAYKTPNTSQYSSFISELKRTNTALYTELEQLIKSNIFIDYFLSVYKSRCSNGKDGWIDFESEISEKIQLFDKAKKEIIRKYSQSGHSELISMGIVTLMLPFISLNSSYIPQDFDSQANEFLKDLNRLIRLLEIYLYEYVDKIECEYRLPDINGQKFDHILSFNYTDTYRKYYDPDQTAQYCFIHGKAQDSNIDNCNMVLGIDEYLPEDRVDQDNQFVWFKKFYQRIFKQTESTYLDWINNFKEFNETFKKAKPSHCDIYIYGHSLDVTDKDVLSKLILMDNTTTHIFYHNQEALSKHISNLVKVIGKENLIRKTGGKNRTIVFIQSQPPQLKH